MVSGKEKGEGGFTLIELLIVIVIIGILAAIALLIFGGQQKAAVEVSAKSDLKNAVMVMATESTKLGGSYPSALPSSVNSSENIVISLGKPETGPLFTNPALNSAASNKWSWAETATQFKFNTGEVGDKRVSMNGIAYQGDSTTYYTYFYPRTGGSSSLMQRIVLEDCNSTRSGSQRSACMTEYNLVASYWSHAQMNNEVLIFRTQPTATGYNAYIHVRNNPSSWVLKGNSPNVPTYNDPSNTFFPNKWANFPSAADTDPVNWGAPTPPEVTGNDSFCLNATHKTDASIKYFYDSKTGKMKEGTC